ncbi:MAG: PAS domain-containing sensor histidine kinase [Candidatus Acidiferrales bacterium]
MSQKKESPASTITHVSDCEAQSDSSSGGIHVVPVRARPIPIAAPGLLSFARPPLESASHHANHNLDEDKLKKHEAMLEQAEEIANIGRFDYDVRDGSLTCSARLLRMLQLDSAASVLSARQVWEIVHPEDTARVQEEIGSAAAQRRPLDAECRCILTDGSIRTLRARAAPLMDDEGGVIRFAGVAQDITSRKITEQELHRLSQQLMQLRDDEQRRMARQLHETAAQTLAALKMTLKRVEESLPARDDVAHALLRSAAILTDDTSREIRTLAYVMHPPMLDASGLPSALRWFVEGFAKRSGISATLSIADDFGRSSRAVETTIFRIVQEALANVHRHSGSRTAEVRLARAARTIRLEIEDQGCGMKCDLPALHDPALLGVGIAGIRERVKQLAGSLDIVTAPKSGTTIRVILPAD